MSPVILQINADHDFAASEPLGATLERAPAIDALEGLLWKVWLRDEASGRSGGIYLFATREDAQRYVDAAIDGHPTKPWLSNVSWEIFAAEPALSRVTRGPLPA